MIQFSRLSALLSVRVLGVALVLLIIAIVYSIDSNPIRDDEAWIAEPVYWFKKGGTVRSELWRGYYQQETRLVTYHKLFVLSSAWLLNLLPWHILNLRLLPLIGGLLLMLSLVIYARKEVKWNMEWALLTGLVFGLMPINFEYFTYYRPEFWVAGFAFGSFWILNRSTTSPLLTFLGGILAGLAGCTHLMGISLGAAGFFYLLFKKRYVDCIWYSAGGLVGISPYMLEIITHRELFFYQLSAGENTAGKGAGWYAPLLNLLEEHKRLFRGPHTIVASSLAIVSAYLWKKYARTGSGDILLYGGLAIICLGMLAHSKASQYSILWYPFAALAIGGAVQNMGKISSNWKFWEKYLYLAAWLVFLFFGLYSAAFNTFRTKPAETDQHAQLGQLIPRKSACLAPMPFVFNEIERHQILGLNILRDRTGYNIKMQDVVNLCNERKIDYLVLNGNWRKEIRDYQEALPQFEQLFKRKAAAGESILWVRKPQNAN